MKSLRTIAVIAGLAVAGSALVATGGASADVKTFTNEVVTDPHIRDVSLEVTPRSLSVTLDIDDLQFQPSQFNFYLTPADTVANAANTTERVFRAENPDAPGEPWSADSGYIRGTSGPDQPGPYSGSFTLTTDGSASTAKLIVTDPVALPWSGPTWISVTFAKSGVYYSAGVAESDGLHGFGPVNDLSIPTSVNLSLSTPTQTYGQTSATVSGAVQPAAPGSVELFDGSTPLGTQPVTEAAPSFAFPVPNSLAIGDHGLHAVFTPTTARFAIGGSAPLTLRVLDPNAPVVTPTPAKTATKTTLKLSHSTQRYKHKRVKAAISVSGKHAGKVRLYDGKHKLKTLRLVKGKATYALSSKLKKGKHVLKAVYVPTDAASFASSTSKKVTLKVVR